MPSQRAALYIATLQRHERVLDSQLDGLTAEDLLLQPQPRGNCANWILGHIANSRSSMLKGLGEKALWGEDERALYGFGSEPIVSADSPHLTMEQLLDDYKKMGEQVIACLEIISDEKLDEQYDEKRNLAEWMNFIVWHEAYHIGQFEYLRQLAGKNDKVI